MVDVKNEFIEFLNLIKVEGNLEEKCLKIMNEFSEVFKEKKDGYVAKKYIINKYMNDLIITDSEKESLFAKITIIALASKKKGRDF